MADPYELSFEFRNQRYKDASKGLAAFASALEKNWDGSAKALSAELRSFLDSVAEALATRHGKPWPGGTSGNTLSKRSGKLTQSIIDSVRITGSTLDSIQGYISADFPAQVHEFGATITPKKAKYLTVPLPAALNSNGTPKKRSAREWENTFVAKSKAGNLIIFQKRGSSIEPLYVLKSSVRIPARLGMGKTLQAGLPYFVDKAMDAMVKNIALN